MKMFNNTIRRGSGASLNLFRYAAKSCDSQGVVTATSYGASDEHPMSIRSASDGDRRKAGIWKYAAMVLVLLTLGVGNAWAFNSDYYSQAGVAVKTGAGTVYVGTSTSYGTSTTGSSVTYADKKTTNTSSAPTDTWYIKAVPDAGYAFTSWTTGGSWKSAPSTSTATTSGTITATTSTPAQANAQANFTAVTVNSVSPTSVNVGPTNADYDYKGDITFVTSNANLTGVGDFNATPTTDGNFTITWTRDGDNVKASFKFNGGGSYGGASRNHSTTVSLQSKASGSAAKTCTVTANFPAMAFVSVEADDVFATQGESGKTGSATFKYNYAAEDDFPTTPTLTPTSGTGAFTVTGYTVTPDFAKGETTVTVNYSFDTNNGIGETPATLTLTAANGDVRTVTVIGHSEAAATDDAKVIAADGETLIYQGDWATAWSKANLAANAGCTISMLRDVNVAGNQTVTNTFTFDLNGKTMHGVYNGSIIYVNTAGKTITIKDSKTGGKIENISERNGVVYLANIEKGNLVLESGTLYAKNTAVFNHSTLANLGTRAVNMSANTTFTMNGGTIEAVGGRNVYGIYQASSSDNNTADKSVVTIKGGTIKAEAPAVVYGILSYGKVKMSAGTIDVTVNTETVNSNASYVAANFNDNTLHRYAYGIRMYATSSATLASNYFGTLTITGGAINVTNLNKTMNGTTLYSEHIYGVKMENSVTGAGAGKTAPDGTKVMKACAIGSIENATITLTHTGVLGYGVMANGCYNSVDNQTTPFQIKNSTINVTTFQTAYGIYADAYVHWSSTLTALTGNGGCTYGNFELTNTTINATTTGGSGAYCGRALCTSGTVANAKDITGSTSTGNGTYYGEYSAAGKIVVNSGTYTASAATSSAYGFMTDVRAKCVRNVNGVFSGRDAATDPQGSLSDNTPTSEAYPELYIHGGDISATTGTSTTAIAVQSGGNTVIDGGTFNAYSGAGTAYGLYVPAGKTTASGVTFPASATTKAYGVYVTGGISDWSLFTYYGEVELNNCNASGTARSTTDARGVFVEGNTKVYTQASFDAMKSANNSNYQNYGDYAQVGERAFVGKATINGGTYTATAETNTAYGIVVTSTRVSTNKEAIAYSPLTVKNATITAKTNTGTTAYGVQPGAGGVIENCTITATAGTTTASGVRAIDKTTVIKNSTISAKGTDAVYGLEGYVSIDATHGYCWHGEYDLTEAGNTKVTAESKGSSKPAYAIYLKATKRNIASGNFAGDYVIASDATINEGTYIAKINGGTSGYALALDAQQIQGSVVGQSEVLINGGKFNGATAEVGTAGIVGHVQLKGGCYVHNTNLAKYIPEGYEEFPLPSDRPEYTEGYRYAIEEEGNHGIDVCKIGSTTYKTLEEALQVATSGNTILMIANYTLPAGDWILKSGVKLLVPYSGQTATKETGLEVVEITSSVPLVTPSQNLKLSFAEGAHLVCNGTIEAGAKQAGQGSSELTGQVQGSYGHIYMAEGSSMTIESGATLYAWGYVTGKGEITIKNGGKSYEMFQFGWYKGGNTTSEINSKKDTYKIFPMTDYSYQNIECPVIYYPGATAYGKIAVKPSSYSSMQKPTAMLVGTADNCMFKMTTAEASANTWVKKVYDPETDITNWIMNSGAAISGISMNVGVSVNSADFYLPITSNFRITLNYGEMNVNNDVVFLPGSQLIINKEATGILKSGKLLFFYDAEDWFTGLGHVSVTASGWSKAKTCGYYYYPATYSPSWGTSNPRKNVYARDKASLDKGVTPLPDAEMFVHGKMIINGSLYTSGDGNGSSIGRNANIHSTNEDAGKIEFNTKVTGSKALYKVCYAIGASEANNSWSDMIYGGQTTAYPAHLTNGDGTYVQTSGTEAGKQYVYYDNQWQCWEEKGCYTYDAQNHPYAKPAAYVQLTSDQPDANHLLHDAATGNRNFVWDQNCYWWEVVTTPTAEGYYKSINADYNGKYNYYYYDSDAGCWKIKKITVTWNINGSTTNYSVGYGTKPEWYGGTPSKSSSSSNYYYIWDGWTAPGSETLIANSELPEVTADITFTAHFYEKYYQYNIIFKNDDGTVLESKNWNSGSTPSYEGTPEKAPTASQTFEFNGTWSPAITTVSKAATYVAQYTAKTRQYDVTFLNYDMSVLGTTKVDYNTTPTTATYKAAIAPSDYEPYKPDNNAYSFVFDGWRLNGAEENGFAQVKGDQTYVAQFAETTKKYRISFVDEDGETVLHWTQLEYDAMPSYDGPATSGFNKQDVEWLYEFSGWTPAAFTAVKGPQTYTAVYNKTKREYTITWVDGNGATLKTDQVAYGSTPSYSGATPKKTSTNTHNYTFNNTWSPAIVPVEGEATYTAQFNETERKYRVTWDANGGSCGMAYNDFSYNAAIGTLPTATKAGHTFNGWFTSATGGTQITTATKVTADVTYHAHFTINTHSLTWDANGGELSGTYTSGTAIAYGTAIDVPTVSRANYIFNGWHNGTSIVTPASTMPDNALTYTAQWTPAVASVTAGGTTYYSTFGDAIDAANGMNNAIVTMLQGVTVTSQIELTAAMTIDLNGKTITSTIADATTGTFYINASGKTITIRDSGTDGKIYQEVKCSGGYLYGIHVHAGTLTIESGTIYTKNTANKRTNGIYTSDNATAINILTGGKVETVSAGQAFGIYIYNSCALTINGGTVTANGSANVRGIYIRGTTTLTNATIESTASGSDSRAIFTNSGVNLTINSGTYTATGTDGCYAIYERSGTTLTINGGRFSGREKEILKDGGSLTITGGVYKHDTDIQGYCATNYHVFDLTSGADYDAGYRYEVAEAYKVTWNATENGGSCETAYTLVKKGTAIGAVPEASKTGHDFLGWFTTISGGGNQVTAATIINFATTAYARFAPSTYDITYKDQGDSDFSGVHGDDYPTTHTYGTVTALVSPTKYGYTFEGWYDNAACTGSALTEIGATAYTADLTLYAKWAIKTNCTITWLNYNDTPLHQSTTSWGGTPYYPAHLGTPTREGDEHRTYTFKGWSPEIHPADGDETYIAQYNMSITTGENGSYTVSGAEDAVATTVQVSGSLHVPEYNSLTTTDLILEASDNSSGMIEGLERLQVNGNAYFDYDFNTDPWHWSAFGVPFEIDIDAAPLLKEKTTPLVLGSDYDIVYYDSEERALHGPSTNCWKYVEYNSHTLVPGRLYMIAFNRPLGHVNVIRFTKASGAAVDFTSNVPLYNAGSGINDNWNGIANPKLFHALLNAGVTECQVHDGGEIKKDGYDMYDMNNKKFFVGKAVFVQVPYNQSPMYADPATTQGPIVVKAPRRTRAEESAERYDVKIAPMAEEMEDHIYLLTSEDKADEYVIVADLVKAGVSPVRAQMWVERYGVQLCKNTTEWINNVVDYPLGISVPADGDYDIWLEDRPDNDDLMYLTLDGERIWNLSYGACTIELKKGTTQRYGIRVISNAPSVTTGMDAAGVLNEESIRKVLIDEKVYIIRNGELYSITGQKAK